MDRNEITDAENDEARSALQALDERERWTPNGAHAARDGHTPGDYDMFEPQDER